MVAHSAGSTVALQLAADRPGLVRSLTLCEPPLIDPLAAPADHELLHAVLGPALGSVGAAAARGDLPAAFDTFMTLVCGPDHRRVMTDTLGAAVVEAAVDHCRYFLTEELAAVSGWAMDPAVLAHLPMPVLLIQGGDSPPPVHRLIAHLAGVMGTAEVVTVPGAGHLMPLTHPAGLGRLIAGFGRSAAAR